MRAWCARKGTARLVATMDESRERECCSCDYVQTRCVDESGVWYVNRKEIDHDMWPAAGGFCVCAGLRKNNQQTTGRSLGKGSGSLTESSTLVNVLARCDSLITMVECHKSQLILVNLARIDYPHESKMTKWRDLVNMMDFNGEKDGESE